MFNIIRVLRIEPRKLEIRLQQDPSHKHSASKRFEFQSHFLFSSISFIQHLVGWYGSSSCGQSVYFLTHRFVINIPREKRWWTGSLNTTRQMGSFPDLKLPSLNRNYWTLCWKIYEQWEGYFLLGMEKIMNNSTPTQSRDTYTELTHLEQS